MDKNARYITRLKADEYTKAWITWMAECAEPFGRYCSIFEMFRDHGIFSFTDEELSTAWGLYIPEVIKNGIKD
jgi:hypothetical protein